MVRLAFANLRPHARNTFEATREAAMRRSPGAGSGRLIEGTTPCEGEVEVCPGPSSTSTRRASASEFFHARWQQFSACSTQALARARNCSALEVDEGI